MPLAKCNLYDYMDKRKTEKPQSAEQKDLLRKFIDIADALYFLHCQLQQALRPMECFHCDLKNENILVFETGSTTVFQITDFGISTIRRARQDQKHDMETVVERQTYYAGLSPLRLGDLSRNAAPELRKINEPSAAADVWAFGVAFSEYSAWLHGGRMGLQEFMEAREGRTGDHLSYTDSDEEGVTMLKPGIDKWFCDRVQRTELEFTALKRDRKSTSNADDPLHESALRDLLRDPSKYLQPELMQAAREVSLMYGSWNLLALRLLVCDVSKRARIPEVCDVLNSVWKGDESQPTLYTSFRKRYDWR